MEQLMDSGWDPRGRDFPTVSPSQFDSTVSSAEVVPEP